MSHWTSPVITAVKERLNSERTPLVLIAEDESNLRAAIITSLATAACKDLQWDKKPMVLLTAMLERPVGIVVTARADQLELTLKAARIARSLGWFLIVATEENTVPSELALYEPILANFKLNLNS